MQKFQRPTKEQEADAEKVYETIPEDDKAVINFLAFTLDKAYGGQPTIGIACEGEPTKRKIVGYTFASNCDCEGCQAFQEWRPTATFNDVMGAAMGYAQDKIMYAKETGAWDGDGVAPEVLH